jgi:carboxypeptidase C (cathepsin A)
MLKNFLPLLSLLTVVLSTTPDDDEVIDLFGGIYDGKIYSGMLDTEDPLRQLHYIFVPSQGDRTKDPVVLWLNGGPGCSSLLGFIQEHGPVVFPDYNPTPMLNKYSWNMNANMLYLESPAGVGFSVNDNSTDVKWDDEKSGRDNRKAILSFFQRFADYAKNDFYIAGESYAGVYVPKLASLMVNDTGVNLKGIIVGNGLTDLKLDIESALVDFAYEHGLYSTDIRRDFEKNCGNSTILASPECNEAKKKIKASLQGLNIYNVLGSCPPNKNMTKTPTSYQAIMLNTLKRINRENKGGYVAHSDVQFLAQQFLHGAFGDDPFEIWPEPCAADPNPTNFFNLHPNKEKLHVRTNITYEECNAGVSGNYTFGESFAIYRDILLPLKKLRIWFYTGDTDGAVPFTGSVRWIPKLNMKIVESYRPWIVNGQTAGYVQEYDGMTYVTIKGTGHMAPQWKRQESFIMFNTYLRGGKLPDR